jgi:hypothetical protein
MKKFCLVIVSLIVLMSFVGCEKADPDPYIPSTNTDAATTQITIEEGNIVARGESEFFKSTITYFFEEGVYAYDDSYIFEGMSVETAASYLAGSVLF